VEGVVIELMKVDKATKLFQTMAIVSLNIGNLTMEVNTFEEQIGYREEGEGNVTQRIG
jgi:hypothetical protein